MAERIIPRNYILNQDWGEIGPFVYQAEELDSSDLSKIVSACRRRCKKQEVVLFVNFDVEGDNYAEYEKCIIFTEKGMIYWENAGKGDYICEISYGDIGTVDYDEERVVVHNYPNSLLRGMFLMESAEKKVPASISIDLSDVDDAVDEEYALHLYSFIMDILEYEDGAEPADVVPELVVQKLPEKKKAADSDFDAIVEKIEKLAKLKEAGILTDEEFAAKKTELLSRI